MIRSSKIKIQRNCWEMALCSKLGGLIRQSVSGNGSAPVIHLLSSAGYMSTSKLFVGAKVVMDRESGRSEGFGSVKFYSSKVALDLSETVCQRLRGQEFGVDPHDVNPLKRNLPDHKRRLLAAKYEVRRNLYKAVCKDPTLPSEVRDKYRYKLSRLPRNSSFTRVRNRCAYTGRPRGVYQQFRMSRIVFRDLARRGELEGIQKASW